METRKNQTVNLRTSPDENELLKKAAERLSLATGKKVNISKTIVEAVRQFEAPYSFNESRYRQCITANGFAFGHFSEIVRAYLKLGIGPMTIELLGSLEYGGEDLIRQKYYTLIEQNLTNLGVTNQALRDLQLQGCEQQLTDFMNTLTLRRSLLQRTRQSYQGLNLPIESHHFSIVEGELQFTAEDKEKIKEFFAIYLNTQEKKDFVNLVDSFFDQYKKIKEVLIRNKCRGVWGRGNIFNIANDEIVFEKQSINLIKE
jgi:hypothetical protein